MLLVGWQEGHPAYKNVCVCLALEQRAVKRVCVCFSTGNGQPRKPALCQLYPPREPALCQLYPPREPALCQLCILSFPITRSLCSASYVSCKRGTARICCWAPCCGAAAVQQCLLPAEPTAANPLQFAMNLIHSNRTSDTKFVLKWTVTLLHTCYTKGVYKSAVVVFQAM